MNEGYESYYIKEDELMLLLAGKGRQEFYGFHNADEKEVTKERVYSVLASLYQKQIVKWEDRSVVIEEPWREMVDVLINARCCLTIESDESYICYFSNGKVIATQPSMTDQKTLKITSFTANEFIEFLWEMDCFPQDEIEWDEEELSEELLETTVKAAFSIKKTSDGRNIETLDITEKGIRTELLWNIEGEEKKEFYKKDSCKNWFLKWLEDGKKESYDIS